MKQTDSGGAYEIRAARVTARAVTARSGAAQEPLPHGHGSDLSHDRKGVFSRKGNDLRGQAAGANNLLPHVRCGSLCSNVDMVQVVAAVLQSDGKFLVGQRMPNQSHPLKWEFPGGKVEPGENPEQALARELEEELGIRGAEGEVMTRYPFTYPGKDPIELIFFRLRQFSGEPRNLIFHDLRWQPKAELAALDFVEGDREFIDGIYTNAYGNHD